VRRLGWDGGAVDHRVVELLEFGATMHRPTAGGWCALVGRQGVTSAITDYVREGGQALN